MPYPINQRAHQFNSIQSVPVSFGLWDTALKFLSPGPRNDVTDHLVHVQDTKPFLRALRFEGSLMDEKERERKDLSVTFG